MPRGFGGGYMSEQLFNCPICHQREWAKITELGDYLIVNAMVCGYSARVTK